jgi:hypothetical protein
MIFANSSIIDAKGGLIGYGFIFRGDTRATRGDLIQTAQILSILTNVPFALPYPNCADFVNIDECPL